MPRTRRYKKAEQNATNSVLLAFKHFFSAIGRGFSFLFSGGKRKLTVMIVPHSQKKVINFQTNIFSLILGFVLLGGALFSFFWFSKNSMDANVQLARLQAEHTETRASFDELRDENNALLQAAQKFQTSLSNTLALIGVKQSVSNANGAVRNGDLSSLFNTREMAFGSLQESADIKSLTSYLEGSVQPIEEVGKMLQAQGTLFSDIPSIWPLKGGIGHISMAFGQNVHPITGLWYIHKGMDFSTWRTGDPIVSTANGQVVTVGYDSGFGNYVIVKHKHGFYTRYAHMNSIRVSKGQFISQGSVVGTVGNTGVTTGPHLHYEVHIGADVVDPAKYVNVTQAR